MRLTSVSMCQRLRVVCYCVGLVNAAVLAGCGGGGGGGEGPAPRPGPNPPLIVVPMELAFVDGELVEVFVEVATDVYETSSDTVSLTGAPGVTTSLRNDATGESLTPIQTQQCSNVVGAQVCTDIWAAPPMALAFGSNHITATNAGGSTAITIRRQGQPRYSEPVKVDDTLMFTDIAAGGFHSCGVAVGGAAYCWGDNGFGQLGSAAPMATCGGATFDCSSRPVPVDGGLTFVALSGALTHTCGIDDQGDAYCWGRGAEGQLGDGTLADSTTPVAVAGGLKFVALSASRAGTTSCGVTASGAAWCWGENLTGETGSGNKAIAATPVQVATALALGPVSVGTTHACGIATTNDTLCWGDNTAGQLGLGSAGADGGVTESLTPATVLGGLTFARVVAGREHACALDAAGAIYCWGAGDLVGIAGSDPHVTTPAALSAGTGYLDIASGDVETCALDASKIAQCWGPRLDSSSNVVDRLVPEPVTPAPPFETIVSGSVHTCALGSDSFAYCWGNNPWGQVGRPPSDP